MSQDGLVDKGIKWLLEKLENGVEEMMKMDKESKGLEITFMKCLSFLGAVNDAYSATRKVMKVGESDPEFLKYYEQVASELKKVENHMKTRLGDLKKILQFTVFDDKIKIPAEKISEALNYYYNNISASNKQGFIEKVRGHGPPVNVLIRLRDQLPRILEDFKKESSGYTRCAQMALLVIIQMVTANEEYVHARFAEEKYSKRNTQCHYELMELVREIYDILGINIDYPEIDEDKVGAIVKNIASSSNDGHHEILIHEALKKEFEGDHFLVMTYNDNWKQPEMTRDGNTYTFHQDGNFYLVHRFKVMLPNNSDKLLESRAKCDDILSDHLYEKKYYWRDVAKKITEQTKSFAIFYSKFGDAIEYRLNYKIDDEVKSALYYKDWTVEGADVNNGDQVVRATFIATLI